MSDDRKITKCNYAEDGTCAFHGVEIERRKNTDEIIKNIPKMLTWQNRIVGWSILVTILILGSYAYTNIVKSEMRAQYAEGIGSTAADIKIMSKQFEQLSTGQARTEERYASLLRSISEMRELISTLTYLQFKTKDADPEIGKKK